MVEGRIRLDSLLATGSLTFSAMGRGKDHGTLFRTAEVTVSHIGFYRLFTRPHWINCPPQFRLLLLASTGDRDRGVLKGL
jgi:hypothetical protein